MSASFHTERECAAAKKRLLFFSLRCRFLRRKKRLQPTRKQRWRNRSNDTDLPIACVSSRLALPELETYGSAVPFIRGYVYMQSNKHF